MPNVPLATIKIMESGYENLKIKVKYLNGTSRICKPPCDPPNKDILELLQELDPNIYGFEWVGNLFEDEDK